MNLINIIRVLKLHLILGFFISFNFFPCIAQSSNPLTQITNGLISSVTSDVQGYITNSFLDASATYEVNFLDDIIADVLLVGGGGSGGTGAGGGGGAGAVIYHNSFKFSKNTQYQFKVGAGALGVAAGSDRPGLNGGDTFIKLKNTADFLFRAIGGGAGNAWGNCGATFGLDGGSGGGGGSCTTEQIRGGFALNTNIINGTTGFIRGYNGGGGRGTTVSQWQFVNGGGGGGASKPGGNFSGETGGLGGDGTFTVLNGPSIFNRYQDIFGSAYINVAQYDNTTQQYWIAGGGGGGGQSIGGTVNIVLGGKGGGGQGHDYSRTLGTCLQTPGKKNTGSGGGGGCANQGTGGNGGDGLILLRYKLDLPPPTCQFFNNVNSCITTGTLQASSTFSITGTTLLPSYAMDRIWAPQGNTVNVQYWQSATNTNLNWLRVDLGSRVYVPGGICYTWINNQRARKFEIWIGSDTTFPGTNFKCYQSQSDAPAIENFTCNANGRYLYYARTDPSISEYLSLGEWWVYTSQSTDIVGGVEIPVTTTLVSSSSSPSTTSSIPTTLPSTTVSGSINSINVNFTIDGVNPTISLSQFSAALPSNVQVQSLSDAQVLATKICPSGYYCPADTTSEIPCPSGTYFNGTNANNVGQCLPCPTGNFCPLASVNPTQCAAGSYRGTTNAQSQNDCSACITGNYCPIGSTNPVNCSAGTFRSTLGAASQDNCSVCPIGQFCPQATTTPTNCNAGTFRGTTGAATQSDCAQCITGNFCPSGAFTPTNCSAGTFRSSTGGTAQSDCSACIVAQYCPTASTNPIDCANGTFRNTTGAASQNDCRVCIENSYCPQKTINPSPCPMYTVSLPGSDSLLDCRCIQGYQCSYTKTITATVTLNTTASNFQNDVGGVRTHFINSVATAANVLPSKVTILGVAAKTSGRRLLSVFAGSSFGEAIVVSAKVHGATGLHMLDYHLKKHRNDLHIDHDWKENHSLNVLPE